MSSTSIVETKTTNLSLVSGPTTPQLWKTTLGSLIDQQARDYGQTTAVVVPWQGARVSFSELAERSRQVAMSLLSAGLKKGDCIGIFAGNCLEYIEIFLGASRIGCPVVVLNNTYTENELQNAVATSHCRIVFMAQSIGRRSLSPHIASLCDILSRREILRDFQTVVLLSDKVPDTKLDVVLYKDFNSTRVLTGSDRIMLQNAENLVSPDDVLNLQFTSGTTGSPKAAMLTHMNLINNGRLVGAQMKLTSHDIVCCPPPLFHCFGLVMGFLAAYIHGSSIVFPSDQFDAAAVLNAVVYEKCTALLGVPTMFLAELQVNQGKKHRIETVRTGLAAGSSVPAPLMERLRTEFGIRDMLIAYGMTETSPVTFITSFDDPMEKRLKTIGKVMPHTGAKIIDTAGNIVARGVRGELCTSGYALQKGYWRNEAKTKEVMKVDENGVRWMHTGDECVMDEQGYCSVTGRIKDLIIRGGENIFPAEIEDCLSTHRSILEASVIGIKDEKYGEVVGCFLRPRELIQSQRPSQKELHRWVSESLGRHKAPEYVFWLGDPGVAEDFPKTGSGKIQKHILRAIGERLVKNMKRPRARL